MQKPMKTHDLSSAIEEVIAIKQGPVERASGDVDVQAIRESLSMTQSQFSDAFGLSLRTLQEWEQNRRTPDGPTKMLLLLIKSKPDLVMETVRQSRLTPPSVVPANRA